jgi:drug/metabolite transporter (DMT)-like permease
VPPEVSDNAPPRHSAALKSMQRGEGIPLLEGLFAVVVWGASFIATKIAVAEAAPVTVVWLRFASGVAILGGVVAARREWARLSGRTLVLFAALGALGITFHQWLQSNALLTARASTSGWIIATTPVFIAVLAAAVLRERLGGRAWLGIVLAAAGVPLVVARGGLGALLGGDSWSTGDVMMLISAPNWAVFSVASRGLLRRHPAARALLLIMTFGWLFTSVQFAFGPGLADLGRLSGRGWAAVLFLGVACSGLAYLAWFDALHKLSASRTGALLYLEPLIATAVAAAVLGEPITATIVLGGAVILLGVWLVEGARATDA